MFLLLHLCSRLLGFAFVGFTRVVLSKPVAHVGSLVKEVAEAVGAEMHAEVGHREKRAYNSSVNYNSNTEHERATSLRDDESTPVVADEASRNYCFVPSAITISCIWEMSSLRYFTEGDARARGDKTVLEPADDEAVVFEEFFTGGFRIPP
jgi:hypothetical protein